MKPEYVDFLKNEVGLTIVGKKLTSNDPHTLKCVECGNKFEATPKAKIRSYKKSGLSGCPECTHKKRYSGVDSKNEERITELGYKLVGKYTGLKSKVEVINLNCECGRSWETTPEHIFSGRSFCRPCNDDKKRQRFDTQNKIRHAESLKNLDDLSIYRKTVRILSEQTYKAYSNIINPDGFPRGRSGNMDAYHLDHIYSIQYCFYHDVPPEICAHHENLRIIKWEENAKKWKVPLAHIPNIIKPYVSTSERYDAFYNSIASTFNSVSFKTNFVFDLNNPYTIPLYSPSHNIGIMFLVFDDFVEQRLGTKSYLHKIKEYAESTGIKMLFVFEDEWFDNRGLVISKIRHQLGNSLNKIYARKCEIKKINML
jgi:predicted  nucleic acid-binding Zn-ribbon protein